MKKVAIVTGGSRGIGAATALLLANQGYAVCVNYYKAKDQADNIVNKIKNQGGNAIAVKADMAIENDILNLFQTVDQTLGPVNALVNNVGISAQRITVEEITADLLHSVFATNVFSTFFCCREAVKRMKENRGGAIVNLSSEAARSGGMSMTHYAASKSAINAMTVGLAREIAEDNIRVNAVSPGVIDTDIHSGSSPERIAYLKDSLPMKRMGTPQEVAELICWLLSDNASYMSGAIVPITGSR